MIILGVSCFYHDAAAALLKDGKIIAASEEERFTRKKHDNGFPKHAIEFCLKQAGITIKDINAVIFYEKPFIKFERILYNCIATFPRSCLWFLKAIPAWLNRKLWFSHILEKETGYRGEVYFGDHHLSHAASSFYTSPFKEAAYLTVDGVGEWTTTSMGMAKEGHLKVLKEIHYPHSLGLLYSTFTAYLQFAVNSGEYKVMGLASYGTPKYKNLIYENLLEVKSDGSFHLNMDYFAFQHSFKSFSQKFCDLFGPVIPPEKEFTQKAADLAASIQKVIEEVLIKQVNYLYTLYPSENLCLAGGVALNCVANAHILRSGPFKNIYIQPAAGDAGGAVGAAYYLSARKDIWTHAYYGSDGQEYEGQNIKTFLDEQKIPYVSFPNTQDLVRETAKQIAENKVVGWFQGRQEFGPRALGHRSILGNPACKDMQEILNLRIKHREKFRPFAPSVLKESANRYFEIGDIESPFMLFIAEVRPEAKKQLPAITHVDGSARLQTVSREAEPLYHALIEEVGKQTGFDIVINTSFNIRGEPIVRTPNEAYNCFASTDMDVLVLGNYMIIKQNLNPDKIIKVDPKKIHEHDMEII